MAGKSDIKKQILEIEDVEELNTSEENKSKIKEYMEHYGKNEDSIDNYVIKIKKCLDIINQLDWKRTLKEKKLIFLKYGIFWMKDIMEWKK